MILLVKPQGFSLTLHPPLGLGYVAAALKANGRKLRILDLQFPQDRRTFESVLLRESPEWVGMSVSIQNIADTRMSIAAVRKYLPKVPIIIGGVYPSTEPEACIEEPGVDIAVVGEGEETIVELDAALVAQVDLSATAETTPAAVDHRIECYAIAWLPTSHPAADLCNHAGRFVSHDHRGPAAARAPVHPVNVAAADAACLDVDKQVVRSKAGTGNVLDFEPVVCCQHQGLHQSNPFAPEATPQGRRLT